MGYHDTTMYAISEQDFPMQMVSVYSLVPRRSFNGEDWIIVATDTRSNTVVVCSDLLPNEAAARALISRFPKGAFRLKMYRSPTGAKRKLAVEAARVK